MSPHTSPSYAPAPAPPSAPALPPSPARPPRGESGWFTDPDGEKRFWDGNAWTTMVARGDGSFGQAQLPGHQETPVAAPVPTVVGIRVTDDIAFYRDSRGAAFLRSARNFVGACVALGGPIGFAVVKFELLSQLR